MQNTNNDAAEWKNLTYDDLIAMPIGKRKLLAKMIIDSGVLDNPVNSLSGWGRFEDVSALTEQEIHSLAKDLVASMTLKQKVGQMTPNTTVEQYIPACIKYNDFPYVAGEDTDLQIPGIRFSDGPSGIVMGNSSTCFPVSMARGASWDIELEQRVGEAMGIEARSLGANLFGGVCVNILRHPAWGRSQETYGEDPYLLGSMGKALVKGVQKHVMACVKHYALNSMENARYKVNVNVDERSLREIYLPHFKACIDEGAAAVMTAYNKVRGEYCGENPYLIRGILREEWNFKGIVISDFIHGFYDTIKAVQAGLDLEMPIEGHYGQKLIYLIEQGKISEKYIDEAAERIITTKIQFSQIDSGQEYDRQMVGSANHIKLAKQVALESTVLLKNENNLLPLDVSGIKRLAVVGTLANKPNIGETKGSSQVHPPYAIPVLEGIAKIVPETIELAYREHLLNEDDKKIIQNADAVVVVVGLTSDDEGEYIPHWNNGSGGDRDSLNLKETDVALLNKVVSLNKRVIVVLQGGGAIITSPWDRQVQSILMTWYPGMEGGNALAEILFGHFNPCGKLPLTLVSSADQLPEFNKDSLEVVYDYFHGYFKIDRDGADVSYPFGFGLSYTSYRYSHLRIAKKKLAPHEALEITVHVTNIGDIDGAEVVQLYIGYPGSKILRHKKDLRGFKRVAVLSGQRKEVKFSLPAANLSYWNTATNSWEIEFTRYTVYVGSSSADEDLMTESFWVI